MSGESGGFTQRLALACARHPWWTIGLWLAAVVASASVFLLWGDVFNSASRFLNEPDSQKAAELVKQHGGGSSSVAQTGAAVQSLADGLDGACTGARKLAKGSRRLSKGAGKLEKGLSELAAGAGKVSSGTKATSAGAQSLSQGLAGASQGAARLSAGISGIEGATGSFGRGLAQLSRGGDKLASSAAQLAGGARDLSDGAGATARGVRDAADAAGRLAGGAAHLDKLVGNYLQEHSEAASDELYQQIIAAAAQLRSGSSDLASGLASAADGAASVASGADRLASGASRLAAGAGSLSAGIDRSAGGAQELDRGMGRLAAGSAQLASGVGSAAAGSRSLAAGAAQLAGGSGQVAAGVDDSAAGAGQIAKGTRRVGSGAEELSKGLRSASDGAGRLTEAMATVGTLNNRDSEVVVVRSSSLTVADRAFKDEVLRLRDEIAALPERDVAEVLTRYDQDIVPEVRTALTSSDGHTTLIRVELAVVSDVAADHIDGLYDVVERAGRDSRFEVAVTGAASLGKDAMDLAGRDLRRGEAIGVPVALIILVIVFGALVAAGVPLALSMVAVVVGGAITVLIGQGFELSIFALNILSATGIAVGIDYSLFIVSRYREERRAGRDKMKAIGAASATASNAVFFSGMTVVFSLIGMLIVPFSIFVSLGIGAMSAVFAAVAAALTLLPALLALLGDKIDAWHVPWLDRYGRGRGADDGWWGRAARSVMRRPWLSLALGVLLLLAIAGPMTTMRMGGFSADSFPQSYVSRRGLDMLKEDFAAGMSEPTSVVIKGDLGNEPLQNAIKDFVNQVDDDGRFTVTGVSTSADGWLAVVQLVQDHDAMSVSAEQNIRDLRATLIPRTFGGAGAEVYVGGATAAQVDSVDLTDRYMPIVISVVLLLSFVLLVLAFRSVPVAVTAIIMNLLSVGAAYGALTVVFQHGWGAWLGLGHVETIEVWVPLLMFCVLFGLSMDYQVFLLSRIREHWSESGDTRDAVVSGVQSTAGIITGAALIMIAVFAGMGSGQLVVLQQLGFGLAMAVLLDAFVVRVVIAPAMIGLIGNRYWWLPRWLEWLPHIAIEGPPSYGEEGAEGERAQASRGAGEVAGGSAGAGS